MGILNKQYQTSGAGIAKNGSKKKGAALFFELFFRKFWLLIEVNMLYSLFFMPLMLALVCMSTKLLSTTASLVAVIAFSLLFMVIIGPATAGMITILRKYTLEKHAFILSDFFKSFKQNFKNAAIIGFADCILILSTISGIIIYPTNAASYGKVMYFFFAVVIAVAITVTIMNFYIFPMIVATDLSLANIIKNAFALTCIALKKNAVTFLITVLIYGIFAFLILFVNLIFALILPFFPVAIVSFIQCFNSYPVIQKYIINPYYENLGVSNPELGDGDIDDEATPIFEDKGGSEAPVDISGKEKTVEKRNKSKGKIIS